MTAAAPVADVRAAGDPRTWCELTLAHENGAVSQASLSGSVGVASPRTRVELYGPGGELRHDSTGLDPSEGHPVLRREFAASVRSHTSHELDAARGLRLQRLLDAAARSG